MSLKKSIINCFALASACLSSGQSQTLPENLPFNRSENSTSQHNLKITKQLNLNSAINPALDDQPKYTTLQVAQTYANMFRRKTLLDLAKANLSLQKSLYEQAKIFAENGTNKSSAHALDQLIKAESSFQAEQINFKEAQSSFSRLASTHPKQLDPPLMPIQNFPSNLEAATKLAIANHPTFSTKTYTAANRHQEPDTASYPKLSPAVQYEHDTTPVANSTNPPDTTNSVYQLFKSVKNKARHNQAAFKMYEAKNIEEITYRKMLEDLRSAWDSYQTATTQIAFLKTNKEKCRKKFSHLKQQQYTSEQEFLAKLLETSNAMYLADAAFIDGQYSELNDRYTILATIGNLDGYLSTTAFNPSGSKPKQQSKSLHKAALITEANEIAEYSYLPLHKNADVLANSDQTEHNQIQETKQSPGMEIESSLKQYLNKWATAWSQGDINTYLNYYSPNFQPSATISHEDWKKVRISRISPDKQIKVSLSNISIVQGSAANTLKASFHQSYSATNYKDENNKLIIWKKVGDTWLIQEERSFN